MDLRFFYCPHCGNLIMFQYDGQTNPSCCGETMQLLKPNTSDASGEKHVPVVIEEHMDLPNDPCSGTRFTKKGCCETYVTVRIGSSAHPMTKDHYIEWIVLMTNMGTYTKFMEPGDIPEAVFCLCKGEKVLKAYCYCNLHKLWATSDLK